MAATGDLKVQTICLWVSMTDLALCSMCNMYRNTMHLCIYCQKNVQHVAHKTGTICFFVVVFFTILQYFYRNCCVGPGLNTFDQKQQISISRNCFQVQCEKFMPVNISYAHITLTETTQLARHVIFHLKKIINENCTINVGKKKYSVYSSWVQALMLVGSLEAVCVFAVLWDSGHHPQFVIVSVSFFPPKWLFASLNCVYVCWVLVL